jgi:hypothetical protein
MDWKKYFCPVCGIDFTDDDDVVVCPECGTPHHRECWKKNGKCANENLHGTDDSLECTYKKAGAEFDTTPELTDSENFGEYNPQTNEPAENNFEGFDPFKNQDPEAQNTAPVSYQINGKPSVLYEIAVKKNQKYYIPRFVYIEKLKNNKSVNFTAFLFPLAWSLYRKMYKLSALIFAAYILIMGTMVYGVMLDKPLMESFNACYEEDPEFMVKVAAFSNEESGATLTPTQQEFYKETTEFAFPAVITWGTFILKYAIKILVCLFANKLYLKKITKSIDIAEKAGLQGDFLKNYIYRKNGTLPLILVAIVGYLEFIIY